jgi:hypothetical protein
VPGVAEGEAWGKQMWWPKSEEKRALRRAELKRATVYKHTLHRRQEGTSGGASPVRRVDPATGQVIAVIPARSEKARLKIERQFRK